MKAKKGFLLALLVIGIAAFSVGLTALSLSKKRIKIADQPVMLIFPKGSTYEKEWKKTDSLIQKGLTQSALAVVESIYGKAKSDKNAPQLVKAIMHRLRLQQQVQENAEFNAIGNLNDE